MNDRLRDLGDFEVNDPTPVLALRARARGRRRRRIITSGLVCAVVVAVGGLDVAGRDDGGQGLSTIGEGEASAPAAEVEVVVPSLVGETVSAASSIADRLGLRASVTDIDADLPGAIVIAQEPPSGQEVPAGSIVGLRTAVPDTVEAQECPGTSHPHTKPESADALPLVDQVDRGAVEAARRVLAGEVERDPLVLGIWDRYAYELDRHGEPIIEKVKGFQLMAIFETVDECPDAPPTFIGGAPVTRVVLDLTELRDPGGDDSDTLGNDAFWSTVAPPPIDVRSNMIVEWTGSEVLVLGGADHEDRGVGTAAYDPETGLWRLLPDMPFVPSEVETTTWTGSELLMLVQEPVGAEGNPRFTALRVLRLDPVAEEWVILDGPDRTEKSYWGLTSAFTGTEWLLWGYPYHLPDSELWSAAYDPVTDSWRDIDPGPLSFRELPGSVWTGAEFIVFGGDSAFSYDIDDPPAGEGAAYDPSSDTWRRLPPAPVPNLRGPSVQWTGSEVLVWGGSFGPWNPTDGAAYDPSNNSWRSMVSSPLYGRDSALVLWNGSHLVITDGNPTYSSTTDGASTAAYDPALDTWTVIPDPPGGYACSTAGVATPFGVYVFGGSVDCTSITTPRHSPLRLDPPD